MLLDIQTNLETQQLCLLGQGICLSGAGLTQCICLTGRSENLMKHLYCYSLSAHGFHTFSLDSPAKEQVQTNEDSDRKNKMLISCVIQKSD